MPISAKDRALAEIAAIDTEAPAGGSIEDYCEHYGVTESDRQVFERFLRAKSVQNRSAALAALVECGELSGYEADALQLHYDSRDGLGTPEEFAAIGYLRKMRDLGSNTARTMLERLDADPYVRRLYGDS
ncbi:MAG TPA: hypothetical protein VGU66_04785 [Candidatus Elarobacter sp.]|nr:hypothetical protein [Candidatus Elarobacter sp.]